MGKSHACSFEDITLFHNTSGTTTTFFSLPRIIKEIRTINDFYRFYYLTL